MCARKCVNGEVHDCFISIPIPYRARKRIWHGIWALVLLMYAPLVHTCISLLHCPAVPGASDEDEDRVSFDLLFIVYTVIFEVCLWALENGPTRANVIVLYVVVCMHKAELLNNLQVSLVSS